MNRRTVALNRSETNRTIIDEERTFFCSELMAKAFKVLGIIQDDGTSCSQFYPHNFSAKGDSFLNITDGVKIEDE